MGKILIIGAIVLVIWVGLEIQNNGIDGAFNGLFAPAGQQEAEQVVSTPKRAGQSVQNSFDKDEARKNRLLEQASE